MTRYHFPDRPIRHEARKQLRKSVKRDAARTRKAGTYDVREHTQQDAEETESRLDGRHKDAY